MNSCGYWVVRYIYAIKFKLQSFLYQMIEELKLKIISYLCLCNASTMPSVKSADHKEGASAWENGQENKRQSIGQCH